MRDITIAICACCITILALACCRLKSDISLLQHSLENIEMREEAQDAIISRLYSRDDQLLNLISNGGWENFPGREEERK